MYILFQIDAVAVRDLSWVLMRMLPRGLLPYHPALSQDTSVVSLWSGFSAQLSQPKLTYTATAYAPIIDAKPADMKTVYNTMMKSKQMTEKLGQRTTVQTMDQQLYAIAQQVKWAEDEVFENSVIRLGGFHTLNCYTSSIGKLWASAGLYDLLVNSDVYAANSTLQILEGKQYSRAIRALTLAYEVMLEHFICGFWQWCSDISLLTPLWTQIEEATEKLHSPIMQERTDSVALLEELIADKLLPQLKTYEDWGSSLSPTFKFWVMFLHSVSILMMNIRAEREGCWEMHLHSVYSMLPYFFICNKTNYSRWTPAYIFDMLNLPGDIKAAFDRGEFAVRETPGSFNGVWSDLGTEKTIVRDAKGDSGIVGLTRKKAALIRWVICRHLLSAYSKTMADRSGLRHTDTTVHPQLSSSSMKRDESDSQKMYEYMQESMTDPFSPQDHPEDVLINISTGLHASPEVQESLLRAVEKGEAMRDSFVESAFSLTSEKSFYDPLQRSRLKTFSDMAKPTVVRCAGKAIEVTINPEIVFRRALAISKARDFTMDGLVQHPVTAVPTALFHEDGKMRRTKKDDLLHKLEALGETLSVLPATTGISPANTVFIRDALASIQGMNGDNFRTFDDLGRVYLDILGQRFSVADTLADVCDQYDNPESVKAQERNRRQSSGPQGGRYQVIGGRSIPPWRKFLNNTENKENLVNFISHYIVANASKYLQGHPTRSIYLAGGFEDGRRTVLLNADGVHDIPHLCSTHEEADTRMILHILEADEKYKQMHTPGRTIAQSPDADWMALLLHHFKRLQATSELWMYTGTMAATVDRRRYIGIHSIHSNVGAAFCDILPAIHVLSGIDTVSSLFCIGKKKMLKVVQDHGADSYAGLTAQGGKFNDAFQEAAEKLIVHCYETRAVRKDLSLTKLREILVKFKDCSLAKLPPSKPSFIQHALRASWQTQVWLSAHIAVPSIPSPVGHGWHWKSPGVLEPTYFEGPCAAEIIQDLLCSCSSTRTTCMKNCSCYDSDLGCTEICPCNAGERCGNERTHSVHEDMDESG